MFELRKFQGKASQLIADRYNFFAKHEERPYKGKIARPFFQALSGLTGSGKTPMLAQAVSLIRNDLEVEPIVLWMSKARAVVGQTFINFDCGKYTSLIEDFRVKNTKDLTSELIEDSSFPLLVLTTTGLFNNKDGEQGQLNIYKKSNDEFGEKSLWERLIDRNDGRNRRPLIIVYDEGHNLSQQQTDILAELEAEAYLLASATMRLPTNFFESVIQPIKLWFQETKDRIKLEQLGAIFEGEKKFDLFITTTVKSSDVVNAELVKRAIQFDGTMAPMEKGLDELMARMSTLECAIDKMSLPICPKAIYVCRTNINDDGSQDDPAAPFNLRQAPPIKILRYLVEQKRVDPEKIAIYADLRFHRNSKPESVNLFSKGEDSFDEFKQGNYQHIIFNLSLQEGWDDPECYLAYIDKSMGSNIQVEQVIGRVLRQPLTTYYSNPLLNSAHFFLRVDDRNVFTESLETVKQRLQNEGNPIVVTSNFSASGSAETLNVPPRDDIPVQLHNIFIDSLEAQGQIEQILSRFPHFIEGDANSVGEGETAKGIIDLISKDGSPHTITWKKEGNTNPVRVRWLLKNAIRSYTVQPLKVVDLSDPRFDAKVQVRSIAEQHVKATAKEIVEAYYEYSDLAYEFLSDFQFPMLRIPVDKSYSFNNSLYPRYSLFMFNGLEATFAEGLDQKGYLWHRNPSAGGYKIPLLSDGDTNHFFPDFIVWKKDLIYCLDTKGAHLLSDAVARKLFDIKEGNVTKLLVRFIVQGNQEVLRGKVQKGGWTVWKMKLGAPRPIHHEDLNSAIEECLR